MLQEIYEQLYEKYKKEGKPQIWISPDKLYGLILIPGRESPDKVALEALVSIKIKGQYTFPRYIDPERYGIKGKIREAVEKGEISLGALVNYDPIIPILHQKIKQQGCELAHKEEYEKELEEEFTEEEILYDFYLQGTYEEELSITYKCGDLEFTIALPVVGDLLLQGKTPEETAQYFIEKIQQLKQL